MKCYCGGKIDRYSPSRTHCSVACFSYDPQIKQNVSISRAKRNSSKTHLKFKENAPKASKSSILGADHGLDLIMTRPGVWEPSYQILASKGGTLPDAWN